jgi:hypothetical protein
LRRFLWAVFTTLLLFQSGFSATPFVPTTTLAAETGNNTSTAASFPGSSNGNIAGANVSKVPTSTLLYPGATTTIYAHFMPWFGVSYHYDIGYDSADPAQVKAQVSDMISRGIRGLIIDWYGPGNHEDQASLAVKAEVTSRNGTFEFAIMEDAGSGTLNGCSDCTSALLSDLTYINNTYASSPAYMRWNGRPVIFFFGVPNANWSTVAASAPGNPIFIFQDAGGFTRAQSGGSFSWVILGSGATDISLSYLDNFYSTALANPSKLPFATAYKGFDDTIASWSGNRHMQQQCGQTWLNSIAELGKYYSTSVQLPAIQLVTWNDYEEGTEIETGIDNCLSVSAPNISGNTLNWGIVGQENTLDHFTVFVSTDGQNLMSLGDYPASSRSVDLSTFGLPQGTYSLYVKAVGKPSIVNHMSAAANYTVNAVQSPVTPADFSLSASAQVSSVSKGSAASYSLNLVPQNGSFGGRSISFSCSGLPAGATCNFNPSAVTLVSAPISVGLAIGTSQMAANHAPAEFLYALTFPAFGTVLAALPYGTRRRKAVLLLLLIAFLTLLLAGCGSTGGKSALPTSSPGTTGSGTSPSTPTGTGTGSPSTAPTTYTIGVTAISGNLQHTTNVSLTIQ